MTTLAMVEIQLQALRDGRAPDPQDFTEIVAGHEQIESKLKAIGAPTKPSDIGWDEAIFAQALREARYTRDRVTFLDLV